MVIWRTIGQVLSRQSQRAFTTTCRIRMSEKKTNDVLFEVIKDKAIITLNRPKALNALNLPMIREIYPMLLEWQKSNNVSMILIKGEGGKAFCAGGDIRSITEADRGHSISKDFFKEEYHLNHAINISKVPWIAILNGITMGGGVGLSVHGQFRLATEKTIFAMPETAIGLIPDVGGGFFLPRLKDSLGTFLALTGHRLRGRDLVHAGIATHYLRSEEIPALEKDLLALEHPKLHDIQCVLERYHEKCQGDENKTFSLEEYMALIRDVFGPFKLEEVLKRLKSVQGEHKDWCRKQHDTIIKMSPTSCKVTLKQLEKGSQMTTLKEVLEMEFEVVQRILQGKDFFEGVRALLVDRDNAPCWSPSRLEEISDEVVDQHFDHLEPALKLNIQHRL